MRIGERNDAELLAFHADQSNFGGVDFAVDPLLLCPELLCTLHVKIKNGRAPRNPPAPAATNANGAVATSSLEARKQGIEGHRAQILAAAGTHGHLWQPACSLSPTIS